MNRFVISNEKELQLFTRYNFSFHSSQDESEH